MTVRIGHVHISHLNLQGQVHGLVDPDHPDQVLHQIRLTMRRDWWPVSIVVVGVDDTGPVEWRYRYRDLPSWLRPTVENLTRRWKAAQ